MRPAPVPYLEPVLAGVWWLLGSVALGKGLSTIVLAAGIGITVALVILLRSRGGYGAPLPPGGRRRLLQLAVGALVLIVLGGIGLAHVGYAELTCPLAAAVVGVTYMLTAPVLDDRAPLGAGALLLLLGAGAAVLALDSSGLFYAQGILGLGTGVTLWLSGAYRTGLLTDLRARVPR